MTEQAQRQRAPSKRDAEVAQEHTNPPARTPEQDELIDATDDLLAEIDEALEGLDLDLAVHYVQAGGQ